MDDIQKYLPTEDAARHLGGLSKKTLERWRVLGIGPAFLRFGSRCFYTVADLDSWAAEQRHSTSDRSAA